MDEVQEKDPATISGSDGETRPLAQADFLVAGRGSCEAISMSRPLQRC
ncbi:hypothetical protein ACLK19_25595 [Escherichia coli]